MASMLAVAGSCTAHSVQHDKGSSKSSLKTAAQAAPAGRTDATKTSATRRPRSRGIAPCAALSRSGGRIGRRLQDAPVSRMEDLEWRRLL